MTRRRRSPAPLALLLVVVALAAAVAASAGAGSVASVGALRATPATASPPAVVREVLGRGLPPAAPGEELSLVRYVIQPGTTLATHVHPGVQIAAIASGELTYTVLTGVVPVARAVVAGTPGPTETLAAGDITRLGPGDAVVEYSGVVHFGRNDGTEPVVILASTLLTAGQPAAIPVNDAGTPVP